MEGASELPRRRKRNLLKMFYAEPEGAKTTSSDPADIDGDAVRIHSYVVPYFLPV